MPGQRINYKQVQLYLKARLFGCTQETAAAKGGFSVSTAGWQYVQVIQGGESFVALASGLQNALQRCGGCPKLHRTDSLSAAYRNLEKKAAEDLTERYEQLCSHYQMRPTRNNRGRSHENGKERISTRAL